MFNCVIFVKVCDFAEIKSIQKKGVHGEIERGDPDPGSGMYIHHVSCKHLKTGRYPKYPSPSTKSGVGF